jgi:hypothetical protein
MFQHIAIGRVKSKYVFIQRVIKSYVESWQVLFFEQFSIRTRIPKV